jgi:Putative endonuclease segE, GIY-YIG domain
MQTNDWYFNNEIYDNPTEDIVGFVYEITNRTSGRIYIGKKFFWSHKYSVKTAVAKSGKMKGLKVKKKTKIIIPSDWQSYYGSSDFLNKEIELLGVDNYSRKILRLCYSKSCLSYFEAKEQFSRDVLLSDAYYNNFIGCKIHGSHMRKV